MKYVIFLYCGHYAVTPVSNYYAAIWDARKISDCSDFKSPEEIIDRYGDWFNTAPWDFEIHV